MMRTTFKRAAIRSLVMLAMMTSQSYLTAGSPGGHSRGMGSSPMNHSSSSNQMSQMKVFKAPTQVQNNTNNNSSSLIRKISVNQGTLTNLNGGLGTKTPIGTLPTFPVNPVGGTGTGGGKKPPFGGVFNPPNGGTVVVDPGPGNGGGKKPPFGGIFNPPEGGVIGPVGNPGNNNPPSNPPGGNTPPSNPPKNGGNCGNQGNCHHGGCWGYGSYFPWNPWNGCYGGFGCPVVQPYALPVVALPMAVSPVVVSDVTSNVDLSIAGATILEKATATQGALVRVKVLNKGPADLSDSGRVALFGADANQTAGEMPRVIGNLPAMRVGEMKTVDLRMPVEAANKVTLVVAIELPANYKDANEADNVAQGPMAQLPVETLAAK